VQYIKHICFWVCYGVRLFFSVALWGPWHYLSFIVATDSAEAGSRLGPVCNPRVCMCKGSVMSRCSTVTVAVFSGSASMCS